MRPARARGNPPSLADVVHRAAEVVDPDAAEEGAIDPQDEDPAVVMGAAVATYLAFRRTEIDRDREELLRLGARAEFDGRPPAVAAQWL
jgi:hypothetical protein